MPTTPADGPAKPARARAAIRASTKDYALAALLAADEPRPPGRHSSLEEGGCIAHAARAINDEPEPRSCGNLITAAQMPTRKPLMSALRCDRRASTLLFTARGALCYASPQLVSPWESRPRGDVTAAAQSRARGRSDVINGNAQHHHAGARGCVSPKLPAPPHACRSASLARGPGAGGARVPTPSASRFSRGAFVSFLCRRYVCNY